MTEATPAVFAVYAIETLLSLLQHQAECRQCHLDDAFCNDAQHYQQSFMADVKRYKIAKARV